MKKNYSQSSTPPPARPLKLGRVGGGGVVWVWLLLLLTEYVIFYTN